MKLTSRKRFLMALNHQIPDQVPIFDFLNNPALFQETIGITPDSLKPEEVIPCAGKLGLDAFWLPLDGFPSIGKVNAKGKVVDDWGVVYQNDEYSFPGGGPIEYPIKTQSDLENYSWPDPKAEWRYQSTQTAARLAREHEIAFITGIRGPFSTASLLMGMQDLFIAFYKHPAMVKDIFDKTTEFFIEAGRKLVENGVDVLCVHEDLGFDTNTLISPQLYQKFLLPYHQHLFGSLAAFGVPVILHSDGNINKFMDWLTSYPIQALHPLQRSAHMDLAEVKKLWGDRLCLIGNVDATQILVNGSDEEIEADVKRCIEIAAPGGGYVMASDHSLNMGIPVANALKYLELAHKHCNMAYR